MFPVCPQGLRRRFRHNLKRCACCLGSNGAVNPPIGKALTDNALQGHVSAFGVVIAVGDAVSITEVKFSQIARKVLLSAMLVDAAHTALEDAKEAFNGVGGYVAASVFPASVVNACQEPYRNALYRSVGRELKGNGWIL